MVEEIMNQFGVEYSEVKFLCFQHSYQYFLHLVSMLSSSLESNGHFQSTPTQLLMVLLYLNFYFLTVKVHLSSDPPSTGQNCYRKNSLMILQVYTQDSHLIFLMFLCTPQAKKCDENSGFVSWMSE